MGNIIYEEPTIISAKIDPFFGDTQVKFEQYSKGKFVIFSSGDDRVKLYGVTWAAYDADNYIIDSVQHSKIGMILSTLKVRMDYCDLILGGGSLLTDHNQKLICAGGESQVLGRVPRQIIGGSLTIPGYKVETYGSEKAAPKGFNIDNQIKAEQWYMEKGIELEKIVS